MPDLGRSRRGARAVGRFLLPLVVDVDGFDDESLHHLKVLILERTIEDGDDELTLVRIAAAVGITWHRT
jgi:hypothetical protein